MGDHYTHLGVPRTATREEIRVAYRRLAREFHPDARGEASAVRMAQINEAWRVLSDPGRRAVYDANLRDHHAGRAQAAASGAAAAARTASATRTADRTPPRPPVATPSRFPWRSMLVVAALGITFVIVNAAFTKPGGPEKPDNLIDAGSCVDIEPTGEAREVICDGFNDGVAQSLIPNEGVCPPDTEGHRDRQGMGQVCVRLATADG